MKKQIQINIEVTADEAEAITRMTETEQAALYEVVTASIRLALNERKINALKAQVNESRGGGRVYRLDEVQGNFTTRE
jgi:hypothetical protein